MANLLTLFDEFEVLPTNERRCCKSFWQLQGEEIPRTLLTVKDVVKRLLDEVADVSKTHVILFITS